MSTGSQLRIALRTTPKKFQVQGVRFLEARGGCGIVGDEMGLGKTLQAIGFMAIHPEIVPAVIVCPAVVKLHWMRQLLQHAGIRSEILEGRKPYATRSRYLILNYDILPYWMEFLKSICPKVLVLDEFHHIKNLRAKRTKACLDLGKIVPHRIALSGTPITNRPVEFYPALSLIAPKEFNSFWNYAFAYCDPKRGFRGRGWDFSGASNLDKLHAQAEPHMIRRRLSEVMKEMPPKIRTTIPVEISNRGEYRRAVSDFLEWVEEKRGEDAARKASGAEALVKLGALKKLAAEGKLDTAIEWIEDFWEESGEKLAVFVRHRSVLQALLQRFPESAGVHGDIQGEDRQLEVDRFVKNPRCRLFIGMMQAAGTGLDQLQHATSTMLFLELGWTPAEHEQAEGRLLRIGQNASSVRVYYMVGKDTIEEKILALLEAKDDIVNKVVDGGTRELMRLLNWEGLR